MSKYFLCPHDHGSPSGWPETTFVTLATSTVATVAVTAWHGGVKLHNLRFGG